jgi:peptide subunit release factor 1 (eRF1)
MVIFSFLEKLNRVFSDGINTYKGGVFIIDPLKPIIKNYYWCDSKFYLDDLVEIYNDMTNCLGILTITGEEYKILKIDIYKATVYKSVLSKGTYHLIKKQKKDGQSAARFSRIAEQDYESYIDHVIETAISFYYSDNHTEIKIKKLIVLGNSGYINYLSDHEKFMKYFKNCIMKITDNITVSIIDKTIEEYKHLVSTINYSQIISDLVEFQSDLLTIGMEETLEAFNQNELTTLYVCNAKMKDNFIDNSKCDIIVFENKLLKNMGGIIGVKWFTPKYVEQDNCIIEDADFI